MSKFEIKMPKLGESITEGTIISWSVKAGDTINEDDILLEVNTAKVSAEIPSPVSGKILEILFKEGDTVSVGTVIAIVELEGEGYEDVSETDNTSTKEENETKIESTDKQPTKEVELAKREEERWYSPVVMQKAKEAGIVQKELDSISGTGYLGRLSKRDIEVYIRNKGKDIPVTTQTSKSDTEEKILSPLLSQQESKDIKPDSVQAGDEDKVIPMDIIRRITSDRMVASKKISPHVNNVIEVDVTKLVRWREQNKEAFKKREGVNLTYMSPIIEATARALKDFPRINSSVEGYNIIEKKHVNIGFAVSLEGWNLIVPVIKDADKLSISGIASSVSTLSEKARNNKLALDEVQGGTFTITNFGSYKSIFGAPIINQPEVAILGVGVIEKKPAVVETPEGDVIAIRHKMYLSLAYDHRVVDGMLGGEFLYRIAQYLENWKE